MRATRHTERSFSIHHECPQCPSPDRNLQCSRQLWSLAQLPDELHSKVVEKMIVPQRPCLDHIFGTCMDPWSCPNGSHWDLRDLRRTIVPCSALTSLNTFIHDEGHKLFFQNHIFVFNGYIEVYLHLFPSPTRFPLVVTREDVERMELKGQELRDRYATRLLDFVDRPDWVGKGSKKFQINSQDQEFGDIDSYRHTIQHLVFTAGSAERSMKYRPGWDWPLKVDWTKLPRLKTLFLDLKYYSFSPRYPNLLTQEELDSKLEKGAKSMECLKLQRLVIYGVCSGAFYEDQTHRERMTSLFETALNVHGTLEFRDTATAADW